MSALPRKQLAGDRPRRLSGSRARAKGRPQRAPAARWRSPATRRCLSSLPARRTSVRALLRRGVASLSRSPSAARHLYATAAPRSGGAADLHAQEAEAVCRSRRTGQPRARTLERFARLLLHPRRPAARLGAGRTAARRRAAAADRGELAARGADRRAPELPDSVRGRGSFLAAHNLAAFHESLGQTAQAAQWRERETRWRQSRIAPARPRFSGAARAGRRVRSPHHGPCPAPTEPAVIRLARAAARWRQWQSAQTTRAQRRAVGRCRARLRNGPTRRTDPARQPLRACAHQTGRSTSRCATQTCARAYPLAYTLKIACADGGALTGAAAAAACWRCRPMRCATSVWWCRSAPRCNAAIRSTTRSPPTCSRSALKMVDNHGALPPRACASGQGHEAGPPNACAPRWRSAWAAAGSPRAQLVFLEREACRWSAAGEALADAARRSSRASRPGLPRPCPFRTAVFVANPAEQLKVARLYALRTWPTDHCSRCPRHSPERMAGGCALSAGSAARHRAADDPDAGAHDRSRFEGDAAPPAPTTPAARCRARACRPPTEHFVELRELARRDGASASQFSIDITVDARGATTAR